MSDYSHKLKVGKKYMLVFVSRSPFIFKTFDLLHYIEFFFGESVTLNVLYLSFVDGLL